MLPRPVRLMPLAGIFSASLAAATEYHVSPEGNDSNNGTAPTPLKTITAASDRAMPGDTVTVHGGIYRERISPPRGGTGPDQRITYQAAPGETAVIKGSESLGNWEPVSGDTWKRVVPNSFFGGFNPFNNLIYGDWFIGNNRSHHAGAVYLNGHWLAEAASKAPVLQAVSGTPLWYAEVAGSGYIFNVAWLQPRADATVGERIDASLFSDDFGIVAAASSEGGGCAGWIEHGDWTRYDAVNFGDGADSVDLRVSSPTLGGEIEVRLDGPSGTLLGKATVPVTGSWTTWTTVTAAIAPTSGSHRVCLCFRSPIHQAGNTTIWAQFPGKNPNQEQVEVNVRQSVFYPERSGVDYITVRGFVMEHAATPWSPPTAEQVGLIGTNWSKGWIIENNTIRYSTCAGLSLGKYGDRFDNTAESAEGYNGTINRALANGWNKDTIGGHTVRGNHISHCEQVGIVGSLGCSFSTVSGNHIHDIHTRGLFSGAEMAGIKFHGGVDVRIERNHIHHCGLHGGIWLDWMAQNARVSSNLLHDNYRDLFFEMNHGPLLIDNNLLLSSASILDESHGEAFVHNLIAGTISLITDGSRQTPYHPEHGTAIAGLAAQANNDMRFFNNILVGNASLSLYNNFAAPVVMAGNVFLKGATASTREANPLVLPAYDPNIRLSSGPNGYFLEMNLDPSWRGASPRQIVTTGSLGNATAPGVPFEQPDGSPYRLENDWNQFPRSAAGPFPGPFESPAAERNTWKVAADATPASQAAADPGTIHVDVSNFGTGGDFTGSPATVLGSDGDGWNYAQGANSSGSIGNLKNAAGTVTSVGLAWSGNTGTYTAGPSGHSFSALLRDYAFVMDAAVSTWTLSGLNPGAVFDLVVYAGANGGIFATGGIVRSASGASYGANDYNSLAENDMYVRFEGLVADGSGKITLTLSKNPAGAGGKFGSLAGLSLRQNGHAPLPEPIKVSRSGFNGGAFELEVTGLNVGSRYILTRSESLLDSFPVTVGLPIIAAASTVIFSDPAPPPLRAFYRAESLP